jgi:hypothetical protein
MWTAFEKNDARRIRTPDLRGEATKVTLGQKVTHVDFLNYLKIQCVHDWKITSLSFPQLQMCFGPS